MKKNILYITVIATLLFSGCNSDNNSNNTTTNSNTVRGTAVDGYINDATVCLDINSNDICDNGEPSDETAEDGTFSFTTTESGSYPIIISGGTDMATNEPFVGTLKNIVDTSSEENTTISPLTTLSTNMYQEEIKTNSNYTIEEAKQTTADNLDLNLSQIDANPMKDKKVFAKAQQIVQTIKVLSKSIQKDETDTNKTKNAFNHIMKQIAKSVKADTSSKDLNISKVIAQLEETKYENVDINIPDAIETSAEDYSADIKTKVEAISSVDNLDNLQSGFETFTDDIKTQIQNDTTSTLATKMNTFKAKNTAKIVEDAKSKKAKDKQDTSTGNIIGWLNSIKGVEFTCASGESGTTGDNGIFGCGTLPVTFKVGAITLGTLNIINADKQVYARDIFIGENVTDGNSTRELKYHKQGSFDKMMNMYMVLLALDSDSDEQTITISSDTLSKISTVTAKNIQSGASITELRDSLKEYNSSLTFNEHSRDKSVPKGYKQLIKIYRKSLTFTSTAPINAGRDRTVTLYDTNTTTHNPILFKAHIVDKNTTCSNYSWKEGSTLLSSKISFMKNDFTVGTHTITLNATCDGTDYSDSRVIEVKLLDAIQKEAVDQHNAKRAEDFTGFKLHYDMDLEYAQKDWLDYSAAYGIWEHASYTNWSVGQGENLYYTSSNAASFTGAMTGWYTNEKPNYDYDNKQTTSGQSGHYTQVAWQETTSVGCAKVTYNSTEKNGYKLLGCRYLAPGNCCLGYRNPFCKDTDVASGKAIFDMNITNILKPNLYLTLDMFKGKAIRFTKSTRDMPGCTPFHTQNNDISTIQFVMKDNNTTFEKIVLTNFVQDNNENGTGATWTITNSDTVAATVNENGTLSFVGGGPDIPNSADQISFKKVGEDNTYLYVEANWKYKKYRPNGSYGYEGVYGTIFKLYKSDL